jgi:acetoacetyl-CoA synthetase
VMDFFQPVKHIATDRPIYGLQARGIDGLDEPLSRIEDMAEFYLAAIKTLQPRGPYVLVGYSLGGLVVLEMAQRLSAKGEKVALLAMLDAYPQFRYLSLGQRVLLVARQGRRGLHSLGNLTGSAPYQPPAGVLLTPAMQRVRDAAYLALTRYRPRFYPGKIRFVRAEISSAFPEDAKAVWAPLAEEFEVETVPGDHLGMIATHYESLAALLSRYLSEAFR